MLLRELEGKRHVSPSWTGSNFDHYRSLKTQGVVIFLVCSVVFHFIFLAKFFAFGCSL